MIQYIKLLTEVLEEGVMQDNRTNFSAKFIPSAAMKYDLRKGFPALTTKQLFYKQSIAEVIGFVRGYDNSSKFSQLGCNFWNSDANENKKWLNSPFRKGTDDLGCIYGVTWRRRTIIMPSKSLEESKALQADGYRLATTNGVNAYYTKDIDQLHDCVDKIINNPQDRRNIMHAWFPELFPKMALPPCHVLYEFVADENNKILHMTCFQRSCDLLLGIPMNIFGGALLLSIISKACGYTAGIFTQHLTNVHLYENQFEMAKLQSTRVPLPLPFLQIKAPPTTYNCTKGTNGAMGYINSLKPEHITLEGYRHHKKLDRIEMAQEK